MSRLEFRCRHRYASGFTLDVDFATDAPITALCGPSGSGKTTVLSMIAGLRTPDSGRIQLGDRLLLDTATHINLPPERRRIGYVFQEHLLFPHLNVRDNLLYGEQRRGKINDGEPRKAATLDELVALLDLDGLLDRQPHTLSGGQRQRVAIGRALLRGPDLLLLDEPLGSVHETLRTDVIRFLQTEIQTWGIPILYVTHQADELRELGAPVIELERGQVKKLRAKS